MTAVESFYSFLINNERITTRQARTMFKVKNVHDLAYRLRNEGVPVYTNRITTSRGDRVFSYRIGTPSESFLTNLSSRHVARARRALYRNAVAA